MNTHWALIGTAAYCAVKAEVHTYGYKQEEIAGKTAETTVATHICEVLYAWIRPFTSVHLKLCFQMQ